MNFTDKARHHFADPGVYRITFTTPEGRPDLNYVGSTTTWFSSRWDAHIKALDDGRGSTKMQVAYDCLGPDAMNFDVIVAMPGATEEEIQIEENKYLALEFKDRGNLNMQASASSKVSRPVTVVLSTGEVREYGSQSAASRDLGMKDSSHLNNRILGKCSPEALNRVYPQVKDAFDTERGPVAAKMRANKSGLPYILTRPTGVEEQYPDGAALIEALGVDDTPSIRASLSNISNGRTGIPKRGNLAEALKGCKLRR